MKKLLIALLVVIVLVGMPYFVRTSFQSPEIADNVPAAGEFHTLLERDLLAFFQTHGNSSATGVSYKLLREGPTQSGVALPKYYVWVKVFAGTQTIYEGAARVAAFQRKQFDITHIIPAQEINADPDRVGKIFPAPLVPNIQSLAGATK